MDFIHRPVDTFRSWKLALLLPGGICMRWGGERRGEALRLLFIDLDPYIALYTRSHKHHGGNYHQKSRLETKIIADIWPYSYSLLQKKYPN